MSSYVEDVLARLRAAMPEGVIVYDNQVPQKPADRYVVLYADTGTRAVVSAGGSSDATTFQFDVISVGSVPEGANSAAPIARSLSRKVQAALVDVRPSDDEWTVFPIQHRDSRKPVRDEEVMDRTAVYVVDQFHAEATAR